MPNHMIQDRPLSVDDLTPYKGEWVALRDGHVVAHGDSPEILRKSDSVKESDALLLVPDHSSSAVFL
jgi:hypothetical protein